MVNNALFAGGNFDFNTKYTQVSAQVYDTTMTIPLLIGSNNFICLRVPRPNSNWLIAISRDYYTVCYVQCTDGIITGACSCSSNSLVSFPGSNTSQRNVIFDKTTGTLDCSDLGTSSRPSGFGDPRMSSGTWYWNIYRLD